MIEPSVKKRAIHRTKIIEGQLRGLLASIEKEDYCIDLLTQSLSIQESIKSLNALLLENHLNTCAKKQMGKPESQEKAVKELLKIYKLSNK